MPSAVAHTSGNNRSFTLTLASSPIRSRANQGQHRLHRPQTAMTRPSVVQDVDRQRLRSALVYATLAATPRPFTTWSRSSNLRRVRLKTRREFEASFVCQQYHSIAQAFTDGQVRIRVAITLNSRQMSDWLSVPVWSTRRSPLSPSSARNDEGGSPRSAQVYDVDQSGVKLHQARPKPLHCPAATAQSWRRNTTYFLVIHKTSRLRRVLCGE